MDDGIPGRGQENAPADTEVSRELLRGALEAIEAHAATLPPPLRRLWREVRDEWTANIAPATAEDLFAGPTGTPAFPLLVWVARGALGDPLAPPMRQAAEATLAWYFALRCQDDVVDGDATPERLFLESSLTAHAVRLLTEAAGDARAMLAVWQDLTDRFAAFAATDAGDRADADTRWGDDRIARQGEKYLPMAGAPAALLIRAGDGEQIPALVEGVSLLSRGLQLTNDLHGARRDLAAGLHSPYLDALGLRSGLHGPEDEAPGIRRASSTGRYDAYIDTIVEALDQGGRCLAELLDHVGPLDHVAGRRAALEDRRARALFRATFQAPQRVVDVELTRRCDLRCVHCFVRAQDESAAELSTALALEVVDELAGYDAVLHLTGGEPFVHPGIWDVLERAGQARVREVAINTHGGRLDDGDLDRLSRLPVPVRLLVSLDGPPGLHDRVRGDGATAAALSTIRRATAAGLRASPGSLLTRALLDYGISRWHAWLAAELGAPTPLAVWPLFGGPGAAQDVRAAGGTLDAETLVRAARQVAEALSAGAALHVADYPPINPLLRRLGVPQDRLWQCGAGRERLCVQADGVVSPCHPLRLPLGRVTEGAVGGFVARALAHPDARRLRERSHDGCRECGDRDVCGSCQAVLWGARIDLFARDPMCEDAKRVLAASVGDAGDSPRSS